LVSSEILPITPCAIPVGLLLSLPN
jgi:hypothetical protein